MTQNNVSLGLEIPVHFPVLDLFTDFILKVTALLTLVIEVFPDSKIYCHILERGKGFSVELQDVGRAKEIKVCIYNNKPYFEVSIESDGSEYGGEDQIKEVEELRKCFTLYKDI